MANTNKSIKPYIQIETLLLKVDDKYRLNFAKLLL